MMHMLWQAIIGLIVGVVAKFVMPGADPGGIIVTALIGLVGGWLGGWLGQVIGLYQPGQPAGFLMSVVGAVILLFLYRAIARKR